LFRWAQADQELIDELRDDLKRQTDQYVAPKSRTAAHGWRFAGISMCFTSSAPQSEASTFR
jgi:hypothetical protein